jgi:ketosteroid isomerase-like protein
VPVVELDPEDRAEDREDALARGAPYENIYVAVVVVRDGAITGYRDYWNPLAALDSPAVAN